MENIMPRLSPFVLALSLICAVAIPAEAAQRAFVSSSGNDANTASGCGLAAPCRSFASAQTVVSDGGEIVALDAAGYGPITITKNVTITANPGFYAGIAAPSGDAVTIATASINVTLRGLNINGTGGVNGVVMTNGNRLSIENCVISNFTTNGVDVRAAATVRIVDSLIRDNGNEGVLLDNGATATISRSKFLGNGDRGVFVYVQTATTTTAAISDTTVSGSGVGVQASSSNASAVAMMSVTRSTLSNSQYGAAVYGGDGTAVVTVSDSMATENAVNGFWQGIGSGTATFESLGNNNVRQNAGGNTGGAITTVSPM
jgi:Right handed beta helix region